LDEVEVSAIRDQVAKRTEIDARRESIISSLENNDALTPELMGLLKGADSLTTLEDLYLPYRPKRRTKAEAARQRGLQPLAETLFNQENIKIPIDAYISREKGVESVAEALDGARDIIAEMISEDQQTRKTLRSVYKNQGIISSKVVTKNKEKGNKFRDYFDWQEPVSRIAGHRLLALLRGESQGILRLSFRPDEQVSLEYLLGHHLKPSPYSREIKTAVEDSYKRLLAPSLENELKKELKKHADQEAILVFSKNLRELLLTSPLGAKRVLALDPGYRTGAKLVCLDNDGRLLFTTTIFPTHGKKHQTEAGEQVTTLVKQFGIEAIAIGNGTASRETEHFIRSLTLPEQLIITLVNEDGASIYSASQTARDEFPDLDITVRGAISIGRRLQDPLAELVKIDPKSIGVGQYQHDVDQTALKNSLDETVSSCVNGVGVELNTASSALLSHVSGLGPVLAQNIIDWRDHNGLFNNRRDLLNVPRLGKKAFKLAAGFLRVRRGSNPLDDSAVHPERYDLVKRMAVDLNTTLNDLIEKEDIRSKIDLSRYISPEIGIPTLEDIVAELEKPGRDPRTNYQPFHYSEDISSIEDLRAGMKLPAVITNVTNFGAFADIGIHQDGLIHISQLADRFVRDPSDIVKVGQRVEVRVLDVDSDRRRISLSMKPE